MSATQEPDPIHASGTTSAASPVPGALEGQVEVGVYEFHAWIGLSNSPFEQDQEAVERAVRELETLVAESGWPAARYRIELLNGQYFLLMDGYPPRRRAEVDRMEELIRVVLQRLPGSWGLVYERADEMQSPAGPNAFQVRVIARGQMSVHNDPFLSPINPVIED